MPTLNWLSRCLVAIGCGCLTAVCVQMAGAAAFQQRASDALSRQLTPPAELGDATPDVDAAGPPALVDGVIGLLEIPRLQLSVAVMEGDDDATLRRAVGHLPGSALPWDAGNTVMAGHRDTFFRPLKDLRDGDTIRLVTTHGTFEYQVQSTEIVAPDDVAVLAPTATRSLTLITCYPFVYVGHAPQRFVIHAR